MQVESEVALLAQRHRLPPDVVDDVTALLRRALGSSSLGTANYTLAPDDLTDELVREPQGTLPVRYEDLGPIGSGGMGEVRRVRDRELGRVAAFKLIRSDLLGHASVVARFVEEAQVAAQLQHPNIAPVYDAGRLADGRYWFTMKEVRGRTLAEVIRGAGWSLHRLVDAWSKVCDGVGYAHARGVVHRDLKPDNVMVGAHGEVYVLDWGLAKVLGRPDLASDGAESEVATPRSAARPETRVGGVLGTAPYMPPEQACGDHAGARSDVYALGAMLYEILSGRAPYEGLDAEGVLRQVRSGPPAPLSEAASLAPADLVALCESCMSREAADRPADGSAVAAEARAWLDGAKKREAALAVLAEAEAQGPAATALRERAQELRAVATRALAGVKPWDPESAKAAAWAIEDEAEALERKAALGEVKREVLLQAALTHAPDLAEAHAALVEVELARHVAAEVARDPERATRAETRLIEHLGSLPRAHATAMRATAWLNGDGALTLTTDPPGATVELLRYERHDRRLVPMPVRSLGQTPLREVPLPMGSYLCVLRHSERTEVRYPVHIGRGEHWDGVPPGETGTQPVHLPRTSDLGPDDQYIPAGWFWSGGDPEAVEGLPRRRLWCDGLVCKRFPVTNREGIAFLDDLLAQGREAEALLLAPRELGGTEGVDGALIYGRDPDGRFVLRPDGQGDVWQPDWPFMMVHWGSAVEYCRWLAARTGLPWRLPGEAEREKAARGVDGRFFPWGDWLDPSWCCMREAHAHRPQPASVDAYPVDESVYGVRGMAGNVRDWCADRFAPGGPVVHDGRVPAPGIEAGLDLSIQSRRVNRGGAWNGVAMRSRCASRYGYEPVYRSAFLGFRPARSYPL